MKAHIHSCDLPELNAVCEGWGYPAWRAAQIWHWLYQKHAAEWSAMHNLPQELREKLAEHFLLFATRIVERFAETADENATRKLAVAMEDGAVVETVLIPAVGRHARHGNQHAGLRRTVCVSTQVGCKYRCAFCASGKLGFRRNLTPAEMVEQVLWFQRELGGMPSNIVFMGVGEPFDNYENLLKAVRILNHPDGLAFGARRMTISTCGVVPGIRRLAEEGLQVELSVSLHAPDDALRGRLMPVNQRYPLGELLQACADYSRQTGRIVTFEYTLIEGVNAGTAHARALAALLRGRACRVNLIPLSPVAGFVGCAPSTAAVRQFADILRRAGVNTTLRASRGSSINAACGQLLARKNPGSL